jgi:xylulokinase
MMTNSNANRMAGLLIVHIILRGRIATITPPFEVSTMAEPLKHIAENAVILGWDFSTGAVKCLAFDRTGKVLAESRFGTDLVTDAGVSELNPMLLEGQARATTRGVAAILGTERPWLAAGISATHHTNARISPHGEPIRRAICWNDQTLAAYHETGLARLGGQERARALTGGPWAVRYSLSHLVKDEATLAAESWTRPQALMPHGSMAAYYLTGAWGTSSISSAASTGIMDLRTNRWCRGMLDALANPIYRDLAWNSLPRILDDNSPMGRLSESVASDARLAVAQRAHIFPTLDDQAAGLVGGGATDAGHVAVILGNSAVVNSSADRLPERGTLDCMKLNWGPYLWMRCYSNGAQFLDRVVGPKPDWAMLEAAAAAVAPGCDGVSVLPFALSEPSIGVAMPRVEWAPRQPDDIGIKVRAAFEAIAYLIAMAVAEHEAAGQRITRVSVSGGIAKSDTMVAILASVLNRPIERLESDEGPALGAAVAAVADYESCQRRQAGDPAPYSIADAVSQMVRFRGTVVPVAAWVPNYERGLMDFRRQLQ